VQLLGGAHMLDRRASASAIRREARARFPLRRHEFFLIAVLAVFGMLLGSGPAVARGAKRPEKVSAKIVSSPVTLPAGAEGTAWIDAGKAAKACSFGATLGRTVLGPYTHRVDQPMVRITWRVPVRARTLTWSVRIRCASSVAGVGKARFAAVSVHVSGHRHGVARLFTAGSVTFATAALSKTPGDPEPVTTVGGGKGGYTCASAEDGYRSVLDASTYCTGYCTWWVCQQRPEQDLKNLGDAWQWYQNANLPKSKTAGPVVGAVAWWGQGAGALSDGHVAYVTGYTSTTVTVTEMNVKAWDVEDTRTFALGSSTAPQGYIYGGPAGNGPSRSQPPTPPPPPGPPVGPAAASDSTPGTVINQATGLLSVFTVGANNSLDDYFVTPGQSWNSAVVAGPGQADSKPAAAIEEKTGLISVLVEGPDNSLDDYFVTPGQNWSSVVTVAGPGSAYSAPVAVVNQSTGLISVLVEGPDNSLDDYFVTPGQNWNSAPVAGSGSTYSAPGAVVNQSTGLISVLVEGPDNSLDDYFVTPGQNWNSAPVAGSGSTYSAPDASLNDTTGLITLSAQGPTNSLDGYWVTPGQAWNGPTQIAGPGTTF
jgi:surface antigen